MEGRGTLSREHGTGALSCRGCQAVNVASAGATGTLLERQESISALDQMLAGVRSNSEGQLVFLGGEAGVGKTVLLRSFCEAQRRPVRILWGACEPLRTARPLGPLLDVAEATSGELEELVEAAARPHEVTAALLRELRARAPTVLVLEDVHWADEATLDVLTLLAARIGSAPALRAGELPGRRTGCRSTAAVRARGTGAWTWTAEARSAQSRGRRGAGSRARD